MSEASFSNYPEPVVDTRPSYERDPDWQSKGVCAQTDPEAFYPVAGLASKAAKMACLACDVRSTCLDYALDNDERFGMWGGFNDAERQRLKKKPSDA